MQTIDSTSKYGVQGTSAMQTTPNNNVTLIPHPSEMTSKGHNPRFSRAAARDAAQNASLAQHLPTTFSRSAHWTLHHNK